MEGNGLAKLSGKSITQFTRNKKMPDILDCIANLSSDEVFTSPDLVEKILDLFPQEVWSNPELKWLDPATKTGIFLRQIAKRLMVGLKESFPDEEERRRHIFQNMLYGIALTDLTALMSRRSVYTSKTANNEKSIAHFDNENGNIYYDNRPHTYKNGACIYCGNKQGGELDRDETRERHAYNFIHLTPEEVKHMKFDVIVGNPPYQLGDGGGGIGSAAMPIYQLFVEQAQKLKPRYIAFITPSRWFTGGRGLDAFRDKMLTNRHIKTLVDYPNSSDCFPGVDIVGGVSYFIIDSEYHGKCKYQIIRGNETVSSDERYLDAGGHGILVRYKEMINILNKVRDKHEETFDTIVSSQKPFGLRTDFIKNPAKYNLPPIFDHKIDNVELISICGLLNNKRVEYYASKNYPFPSGNEQINKWKIFMPSTYGCPAIGENSTPTPVLGTMVVARPNSVCTETFCSIGPWNSEEEALNAKTYISTKLFRFLVGIKKTTQRVTKDTYSFVPLLDMHKEWTDEKLYERYGITAEEQDFINNLIKEMD